MRVSGAKGPTRAAILEAPGPGLYPITVSVLRDGELLTAHLTVVEYSPSIGATDWLGPLGMSVIAAITEPDPSTITSALVSTRNEIDLLGLLAERKPRDRSRSRSAVARDPGCIRRSRSRVDRSPPPGTAGRRRVDRAPSVAPRTSAAVDAGLRALHVN